MELDINDFEIITNRLGETYLQYATMNCGERLVCLHVRSDKITRCTIAKHKVRDGQYRYVPGKYLPGFILGAYNIACLNKTKDELKDILKSMLQLIPEEPEQNVPPDSCVAQEGEGLTHGSTSQAGAG